MNYSKQVLQLNPVDVPYTETDYYKFFQDNGFIDNRIEAKIAYLSDRFGFIKGQDKINSECIDLLNNIGSQYFYIEIAPTPEWLQKRAK